MSYGTGKSCCFEEFWYTTKILDNCLDFALVEENVSADYLDKEYLGTDYMRLILPKDHYLSGKKRIYMKDISQFPLLLREKRKCNANFFRSHICNSWNWSESHLGKRQPTSINKCCIERNWYIHTAREIGPTRFWSGQNWIKETPGWRT